MHDSSASNSQQFFYLAHGLLIDSDVDLPELNSPHVINTASLTNLRIRFIAEASIPVPHASQWRARAGYRGWMKTAGLRNGTLMQFADTSSFFISEDGSQIEACCGKHALPGQFRHNLLHQAVPYALIASGRSVLHGGAINLGDGVAIFLGASGAGKSTLVHAFAAQKRLILGDDVVRVGVAAGTAMAFPSYPSIRVWSDEATGDTLLPKLRIGASEGICLADNALPIHAIYHLQSGRTAAPDFKPMPGMAAAKLFFNSTYLTHVVGRAAAKQNFETLMDIASTVPIFTVKYRRTISSLSAVTNAITSHFQSIQSPRSTNLAGGRNSSVIA